MITRRAAVGAAGAALSWGASAAGDSLLTDTRTGRVRGLEQDGIKVFRGIPYGADTRLTRFRPPAPPKPWAADRSAEKFGPMAPQILSKPGPLFASWTFETDMSEDCLALNVWTPEANCNRKRPVMVWLHGGDFSSLSGSRNVFDGTRLAQGGDVVVVTLNHRLNIFGYLYLDHLAPDFAGSGNAGMLDIVAALRWVADNIENFGGDPGNVTIFGQSGGGAKVTALMAMPAAHGLFHKAIVQSGSYYLRAMTPETGTAQARALLEVMHIPDSSAAILAGQPLDQLLAGLAKVSGAPVKANFRPVADGGALPWGPFDPTAPALSARLPLIVGTTATEMTALIGGRDPTAFALTDDGLRQRLETWLPANEVERAVAGFRASRPNASPSEIFFALSTDLAMREGAWKQAERKAAQHAASVFLYELDWKTPVEGGKWGSPHSLCLAFVFDNVALSASMVGAGPEAQKMADAMSRAWLAFAHTGDPNHKGLPRWPAYSTVNRGTMVFDNTPKVINDFRADERILLRALTHVTTG